MRHLMVISSSLFSTWAFVVFISRVFTSGVLELLTLEECIIQIAVRSSVLM